MILFEYQCPQCQYIRSELRHSSENTDFATDPCVDCNVKMPKILSATYGYVKGSTNPVRIK